MRHHKLIPAHAGVVHRAHDTRPDLERLDDRCLLSGLLPAGSLDPTFGSLNPGSALRTGYVLNPNLQTPSATAIQSNGSVLVGSETNNPFSGTGTDFQIMRYTSAGQLGTSFGVNGQVVTDFAKQDDQLEQLIVDNVRGLIYAVGQAGGSGSVVQVGIARYTMNGKVDPSFGMGGKVTASIMNTYLKPQDYVETAVLDPQGKLIVGGMATGVKISGGPGSCANFMARFNLVGGSLDTTFGTSGKIMGPVMPMVGDYVYEIWNAAMVLPGSNTIVTVGTNNQKPEVCQFTLSGNMVAGNAIGVTLEAVAFAPGGTWFASASTVAGGVPSSNIQLSAYTISGVPKFPTVTVNLASELHLTQASPVVNTVAIDAKGRIVVGGGVSGWFGPKTIDQALLMRFTPGGQLDTTFGPQVTGIVTTDFGPGKDFFTQVLIQNSDNNSSDSKIVAAGQSKQAVTDMVLARYLGEPLTLGGLGGGQAGGGLIAQVAVPSAAPVISSLLIDPLAIEPWSITPQRKGH